MGFSQLDNGQERSSKRLRNLAEKTRLAELYGDRDAKNAPAARREN